MYKLDTIDKALLKLLQENGRATISSLSSAVSLSMPAVSERVKRLEASGVIQKFTTLLNPSLVD
ncbi:MAG: AsnC family transcriptional regulator, partial [Selenomonadaceae bacterium]|nr:AsnC family transcriptional regulator [Selenomonadaceae bacterium]